jgi:ABC-type Fe3+-hydroxamate transport system substrate-binding protein
LELLAYLKDKETILKLDALKPYAEFANRCDQKREELRALIKNIVSMGKKVYGYGASTKGNVILQYSGLDASLISGIFEVNSDKWGKETPGTRIPIIAEDEIVSLNPDYLLVLPWHFRDFILAKERTRGLPRKIIFPLPNVEVLSIP